VVTAAKVQLPPPQVVDSVIVPFSGELPMKRYLAIIAILIPLVASGCAGCTWQANNASQAVDYTPGKGLSPANGSGYMDGVPQDTRTKK
jgi:hypothetical protein